MKWYYTVTTWLDCDLFDSKHSKDDTNRMDMLIINLLISFKLFTIQTVCPNIENLDSSCILNTWSGCSRFPYCACENQWRCTLYAQYANSDHPILRPMCQALHPRVLCVNRDSLSPGECECVCVADAAAAANVSCAQQTFMQIWMFMAQSP